MQKQSLYNYLGYIITQQQIYHHLLSSKLSQQCTLNYLQKMLEHVNWVYPYLPVTTKNLTPFFKLLSGSFQFTSIRSITSEAEQAFRLLNNTDAKAVTRESIPCFLKIRLASNSKTCPPLPPECWDQSCAPPPPSLSFFLPHHLLVTVL